MQLSSQVAAMLTQRNLDDSVHVLKAGVEHRHAGLVVILHRLEPILKRSRFMSGKYSLATQHPRMRDTAGDIVRVKPPVIVN